MMYRHRQANARARSRGYTLVELMVVVVIVGILAAVAIPSFISYLQKSKTSEAISFLAAIKQRQASYFAEFGQYCQVSGNDVSLDDDDFHPEGPPGEEPMAWTTTDEWTMLGAAPDSAGVYFQYASVAGAPGTTPDFPGDNSDRGYSGNNFWFISAARADLDGDDTMVTFESYSASAGLYVSEDKGWE